MSAAGFALDRDEFGRLVIVDGDGVSHVGGSAVRAFPLSAPDRGVSLCDENGREVVWIDDLSTIGGSARRLIDEELVAREFLPRIVKVHRVSSDSTPCEFDVETDRGRTRFTLDSDEQIRKVSMDRMIVTDARGVRYQVLDLAALDAASRRMLERHL